jgi:hypothetical protein
MDEAKTKSDSLWYRIPMIVCFFGILNVVFMILRYIKATPLTRSAVILLVLLVGYPLFLKGTVYRWGKDKREMTFLFWAIFSVAISLVTLIGFKFIL